MKRIVTGITTTGKLTLGNYIGAIKPLLDMQEHYDLYVFAANLHGVTLPIDKEELKENTFSTLSFYLASGLNPQVTKLFVQSEVPAITKLSYLLTVNTTMGELSRMTQFKDKSQGLKLKNGTETIPTGLFIYPILMTADILAFQPEIVTVGKDQSQHLELTRTIIERLNSKYGLDFVIPKTEVQEVGHKIMSLKDPSKKMSKSDSDIKNVIFMTDTEDEIRSKIKSAMTDDENKVYFDEENKPGVSNLLTIYAALTDIEIEDAEKELKDMNYGDFKDAVATKIVHVISPIQQRYEEFMSNKSLIRESLDINLNDINTVADATVEKVMVAMGLK